MEWIFFLMYENVDKVLQMSWAKCLGILCWSDLDSLGEKGLYKQLQCTRCTIKRVKEKILNSSKRLTILILILWFKLKRI